MKYFIASDIHGSAYYCRLMVEALEREKADKLLLLGDLLYHGPRNDLPKDYAPRKVIELLNPYKRQILCVRGNCDAEVDQMVLDFPIMADYSVIRSGDFTVYATHGHKYNEHQLPPLCDGDILLHGHTHVPRHVEYDNFTYVNPGSVSMPKEGSLHSYMIMEDGVFTWKELSGNEIDIVVENA